MTAPTKPNESSDSLAGQSLGAAPCSVFDLKRCPKCGGTTGFIYKITIQGEQFQPWNHGHGEAHFEGDKTKHGAKRCVDCGKIIRPNDQVQELSGASDSRRSLKISIQNPKA